MYSVSGAAGYYAGSSNLHRLFPRIRRRRQTTAACMNHDRNNMLEEEVSATTSAAGSSDNNAANNPSVELQIGPPLLPQLEEFAMPSARSTCSSSSSRPHRHSRHHRHHHHHHHPASSVITCCLRGSSYHTDAASIDSAMGDNCNCTIS